MCGIRVGHSESALESSVIEKTGQEDGELSVAVDNCVVLCSFDCVANWISMCDFV